uniref:FTP domain-containing protein n=1 Tax=Macrostomum lignano TaxID=282301 RepID=A0A1I8F1D7_9PLAT
TCFLSNACCSSFLANILVVVTLLFYQATASSSGQNERYYTQVGTAGGNSFPPAFKVLEGSSIRCSIWCWQTPRCLGFYWTVSSMLCQLFNASVYYWKPSWGAIADQQSASSTCTTPRLHFSSTAARFQAAYSAFCTRAMDNNTNTHFFDGGSCIHTNNEIKPWWEADLAQTAVIVYATIYNRIDMSPERLNNFENIG